MNAAGIDVAHKTLALAIAAGRRSESATEFANTASGHRALIKVLKGAKVERVCLEATGTYHLDLALALDAAGLAIMVVNPKAAKHFAEALLSRTKTDAVDAAVLAQFARAHAVRTLAAPDEQALALRACARRIGGAESRSHPGEEPTPRPEPEHQHAAGGAGGRALEHRASTTIRSRRCVAGPRR